MLETWCSCKCVAKAVMIKIHISDERFGNTQEPCLSLFYSLKSLLHLEGGGDPSPTFRCHHSLLTPDSHYADALELTSINTSP